MRRITVQSWHGSLLTMLCVVPDDQGGRGVALLDPRPC